MRGGAAAHRTYNRLRGVDLGLLLTVISSHRRLDVRTSPFSFVVCSWYYPMRATMLIVSMLSACPALIEPDMPGYTSTSGGVARGGSGPPSASDALTRYGWVGLDPL